MWHICHNFFRWLRWRLTLEKVQTCDTLIWLLNMWLVNIWFKQLNGEYLNWIFQYCFQKSVCWRFLPAWLCMPYNPSLNVNISLDPQQCLSTQAWYFLSDPSQIIALCCQSLSHSLLFVNLAQGLSKVIFLKDAINLELFLGGLFFLLDEFY